MSSGNPTTASAPASTITVVTPSFNQAGFLPDCLASVARQRHKPIEHLIYDPGSTDGSREIAASYSAEHDWVQLIQEPDGGQSDAVSRGMLAARGDIIAWMNSDDMYADEHVFSQVIDRFNQDDRPDLVYGLSVFIDAEGNKLKDVYINRDGSTLNLRLHHEVGIAQPSVFMRRSVPQIIGTLDPSLRYAMDYDYWVRASQAGLRFAFLPVVLSCYRYYPQSKTAGQRERSLYETLDVVKRHYGYVHIDWLKRYAACVVCGHDGMFKSLDDTAVDPVVVSKIRELARFYNTSADCLELLTRSRNEYPYRDTYRAMDRLGIALSRSCVCADEAAVQQLKGDPGSPFIVQLIGGRYGRRFAFDKQWIKEESEKARARLPLVAASRADDTCIIVGNGPSLVKTDLNLLQGHDVFVSNNAFINEKLIALARYYAVVNNYVAEQGYWHMNSLQHVYKFFPWFLGYCLNSGDNTFFLNAVGDARFCTDILDRISWKSTVSIFMMQIAYWLGYRKVVLVGFDHSYAQPENAREGTLICQEQDDVNHFDPTYFRGKRWQAADVKNMEEMYWLARSAFEADGREIINATVGGHLEVFRRDSLENALSRAAGDEGAGVTPPPVHRAPSTLIGDYPRHVHAHFNEGRLVLALPSDPKIGRVMIDVGAHSGGSLSSFLSGGWSVNAFEPDPVNRSELQRRLGQHPGLTIDARAVTDRATDNLPFYASAESTGINSLHPFHECHKETCMVSNTTIADYAREKGLQRIDYLKINAEGCNFRVLKGVPWETIKPSIVMCEFEDSKTMPLGYTMHDMARYLIDQGYTVLVSEWHPIVRYGVKHDWRRLVRYPCELESPAAWGNLIALLEDPGDDRLRSLAMQTLEFPLTSAEDSPSPVAPTSRPQHRQRRPGIPYRLAERLISRFPGLASYVVRRHPRVAGMYRQVRDRGILGHLRENYPTLMHLGRFVLWSLGVLKRTLFGIGGAALLVVAGLFAAGALVAEPLRWYLVGIAGALLILGGGVLALSYARSVLSQAIIVRLDRAHRERAQLWETAEGLETTLAELKKYASDTRHSLDRLNKNASDTRHTLDRLNKDLAGIKDDVFIIGYDILKEQGKLTDRVSQLETRAGDETGEEQPTPKTGE